MKHVMKEVTRKEFYVFSPFLRVFHWLMVSLILVLFATGVIIATPLQSMNLEPTFSATYMDLVRDIHFVAAFLFCASFVLRIYGFIVNKGDRLFPHVWKGRFYRNTLDVLKHYMLVRPNHSSYLRNPMARMSYILLYALVFIEFVTGFCMYYMRDPNGSMAQIMAWVNVVCGNEMNIHLVHHYVAWGIILFAIGHLYMVIRSEFMEGESEVSSMFSGSKFLMHYPVDAVDIETKADRRERLAREKKERENSRNK